MRVVVTGATGFIGRTLCRELSTDCEVVALTRDASRAGGVLGGLAQIVEWDSRTAGNWSRYAEGALAIVNLAGESVASGRWSTLKKNSILQSRFNSSRAVYEAVRQAKKKPKLVIQASAIGYYGSRGDELLDEESVGGGGFLADVCRKSESFGEKIESLGVRCAIIRTGVVLGLGGGALPKLAFPFRFYLGGCVGRGQRWLSWISLGDEVGAIRFLMRKERLRGVFNLTSPNPVTMKEFCRTLGAVLKRPAWLGVPGSIVRLAFGEMAEEMLLASQKVVPRRLSEAGFEFAQSELKDALTSILEGEIA
jgi:uncharacterized protein (TIGR01777 family)